jgi:hypothetical protein
MNISKPLPRSINLEYQDVEWEQTIDYEHIPFRCCKCHEMTIFSKISLSMLLLVQLLPFQKKSKDDFTQVQGKRPQYHRRNPPYTTINTFYQQFFEILNQDPGNTFLQMGSIPVQSREKKNPRPRKF